MVGQIEPWGFGLQELPVHLLNSVFKTSVSTLTVVTVYLRENKERHNRSSLILVTFRTNQEKQYSIFILFLPGLRSSFIFGSSEGSAGWRQRAQRTRRLPAQGERGLGSHTVWRTRQWRRWDPLPVITDSQELLWLQQWGHQAQAK